MTTASEIDTRRQGHAQAWPIVAEYARDRSREPGQTETERGEWLKVSRDATALAAYARRPLHDLEQETDHDGGAVGGFMRAVGRELPPRPGGARLADAAACLDDADDARARLSRAVQGTREPTAREVRDMVASARAALTTTEQATRVDAVSEAEDVAHGRASILAFLDACRATASGELPMPVLTRADVHPDEHDDPDPEHDGETTP